VPTNIDTLVEGIKVLNSKMDKAEGKAVLHTIELASMYVELRQNVKNRQWERTLKEVGISPRVASRYLTIGESWWLDQQPGPDELARLPWDLEKLESLSKLSVEALPIVLKSINPRQDSRGAVKAAVQRVTGGSPSEPADDEITVKKLQKQLSNYVHCMVNVIEDLEEHDLDDEAKEELWNTLQATFSEVKQVLHPSEEVAEPTAEQPADEDEDDFSNTEEEPDDETVLEQRPTLTRRPPVART